MVPSRECVGREARWPAGTDTLNLGSCDHLEPVQLLTWANGVGVASLVLAAFTVIPRCFPLGLVRLWCDGPSSSGVVLPLCDP